MDKTIELIIKQNEELFGTTPKIERINVGFTNTIYNISDTYIVKICSNIENEEKFKKEIDFYLVNKENNLIPKLYKYSVDKSLVPCYYEILEKVEGVTLYNVWHTYNESQRKDIIRQLCEAMKNMHENKGKKYDWSDYMKKRFDSLFDQVKKMGILSKEEQKLIEEAYSLFDEYLKSDEFVLVHNDLHFDNIFVHDGKIKVIDFERSMYAPRDYELAIIYRMIRKPWKFASEETEKYTDVNQYSNIIDYIGEYYPKIINTPNLYKRLAIYDIVYMLKHLIEYPHLDELKKDILEAVQLVMKER